MSDFDLTPDEKAQVIGQRMNNLKAQRYDAVLTLELATKQPASDPLREPTMRQAKAQIEGCEKVLGELQSMLDGQAADVVATNGNRAARRAHARKRPPARKK